MKKLNLEMLRLSTDEVLERSQMKKITGGYGMSYCATMYMIRSCNQLSGGAYSGWAYGWTSNGCNNSGGANYWNAVTSAGYSMQGCSTGWYSY
ncbi:hypothetical protein Aoki45_40090 [Algoriphagus sp. oki45]|jgi:natural product precursor|uniref:Bacteriocin n=1 Tax=Algoriphagus confluentis TaxID=1697556 RepID=A0ABQ6PVM9_9BACT|nr:hypothetical protein Aoki45_40090 [Algoriphagus sp. oki45]GMQ31350.1 hypothetical protein Aconfl_39940 [Algoriphagus confluentis]